MVEATRSLIGVLPVFQMVSCGAKEKLIALVCAGSTLKQAAEASGVSYRTAKRVWHQRGHVMLTLVSKPGGLARLAQPVEPVGPGSESGVRRRQLSDSDRMRIAVGIEMGLSQARIAVMLGRDRTVIWRELRRNSSPDGVYRAEVAIQVAASSRRRPKSFKLATNPALARRIEAGMDAGWSPALIAAMLKTERPNGERAGGELAGDERGQNQTVSHETIYRALYVQARGGLRADLSRQLSTKRSSRVAQGSARETSPYREAFRISQRPAEVQDRAVPGHWEGDLIMGAGNRSAIGTLVERSTRFVILLHLPDGRHDAATVAQAMIREMRHLPQHLRQSITWDRGTELADYATIELELSTTLFFCDPHSPWQRGTNENTNRLLRFWFAKGTDLSTHTPADLRRVAATLNARPRPTLDLDTPAHRLNTLLNQTAA